MIEEIGEANQTDRALYVNNEIAASLQFYI